MDPLLKKFYTQSYMKTNGFTPLIPNNIQVLPGDFFQIREGTICVLGNIFRDRVIDPKDLILEYDIDQNPSNWHLSEGIKKPFFGKKNFHNDFKEEEKDIRTYEFDTEGSFFFSGSNPRSVKIKNWNELEQQLTIKLTQILYSFRDLYVVTETASLDEWVFALANDHHAKLELIVRTKDSGETDFFGHTETKAVFAEKIEYYLRSEQPTLSFFKAKQLTVRDQRDKLAGADAIRSENILVDWTRTVFKFDFPIEEIVSKRGYSDILLIDKLKGNELNPNTALEYFHWTDLNLDDIERLFIKNE